jgi:nuclear pore complex protein Nup160
VLVKLCSLLMQITGNSRFPYLLYVLTVSGVAYLLRIRNVSAYGSCSVLPEDEIIELNVHDYVPNNAALTAVTATSRCLVIGTSDGSVFCFQLGLLDAGAPGMVSSAYIFFSSFCMRYC